MLHTPVFPVMNILMKLTILGCGGSAGVPLIGCNCAVCSSANPKNARTRASVLFETAAGTRILVDASPDLRTHALRAGIASIDALILTHAHADHCHGLDDVRSFNYHKNAAIELYADAPTMEEVQQRFAYIFKAHQHQFGWYKPEFHCHTVASSTTHLTIADADVCLFPQTHGRVTTLGVRIGDMAYSTDVNHLTDEAFNALHGVRIWVVDCLRPSPSPTHAHLELTLKWIARVRPERAILTHMSHEFDYEILSASLPKGVEMAWDGMTIE
jgi:phosphoribosyl 1,2-cyclic phosphate phosphodiesterase